MIGVLVGIRLECSYRSTTPSSYIPSWINVLMRHPVIKRKTGYLMLIWFHGVLSCSNSTCLCKCIIFEVMMWLYNGRCNGRCNVSSWCKCRCIDCFELNSAFAVIQDCVVVVIILYAMYIHSINVTFKVWFLVASC